MISPRSLEELGDLDEAIGGKSLEMANRSELNRAQMANGSQGKESSNYSSIEQSDGREKQSPAIEFLAQATNFTSGIWFFFRQYQWKLYASSESRE